MSDRKCLHHVSSAVVAARPEHVPTVINAILAMKGTEIPVHENGRIVVVMEGGSTGELGDRLTQIATIDGVIAANMVFEHVEETEAPQP